MDWKTKRKQMEKERKRKRVDAAKEGNDPLKISSRWYIGTASNKNSELGSETAKGRRNTRSCTTAPRHEEGFLQDKPHNETSPHTKAPTHEEPKANIEGEPTDTEGIDSTPNDPTARISDGEPTDTEGIDSTPNDPSGKISDGETKTMDGGRRTESREDDLDEDATIVFDMVVAGYASLKLETRIVRRTGFHNNDCHEVLVSLAKRLVGEEGVGAILIAGDSDAEGYLVVSDPGDSLDKLIKYRPKTVTVIPGFGGVAGTGPDGLLGGGAAWGHTSRATVDPSTFGRGDSEPAMATGNVAPRRVDFRLVTPEGGEVNVDPESRSRFDESWLYLDQVVRLEVTTHRRRYLWSDLVLQMIQAGAGIAQTGIGGGAPSKTVKSISWLLCNVCRDAIEIDRQGNFTRTLRKEPPLHLTIRSERTLHT